AGQFMWKTAEAPLNETALKLIVESDMTGLRRAGTTDQQVLDTYQKLCNHYAIAAQDVPAARTVAEGWLRQKLMAFGIERAQTAVARGDVDSVQTILRESLLAPADNGQGVTVVSGTGDLFQAASWASQ